MKQAKRGLALLLVLVLALTMLPMAAMAEENDTLEAEEAYASVEEHERMLYEAELQEMEAQEREKEANEISTRSLVAGDHINATLDMTGKFPEELKAVSVQDIVDSMVITGSGAKPQADKIAAYTKWYHYTESGQWVDKNDDYVVLKGNTIDLSNYNKNNSSYSKRYTLSLIVGTADQLNPDNKIYDVTVETSYMEGLFEFSFTDKDHKPVTPFDEWSPGYAAYTGFTYDFMEDDLPEGKAYAAMGFNAEYPGLTVQVYKGTYRTEESITSNPKAEDITDQIWNPAESGGYLIDTSKNYFLTAVIKKNGTTVAVSPIILCIYRSGMGIIKSNYIYSDNGGARSQAGWYDDDKEAYQLDRGLSADSDYYCNFEMINPADPSNSNNGIEYVKKAVVGKYSKISDIPQDAADIKDQLFSDASATGGYKANFSKTVFFTIVDINDDLYWCGVKVVTNNTPEPVEEEIPDPLSPDTYMEIDGADKEGGGSYNSYVMPYDADSYYYNGFQTVFLLNYDGSAVSDANILPSFSMGRGVRPFLGHDGSSGTAAVNDSGAVVPQSFTSGQVLPFSAAAENAVNLKNYWVTFVTQDTSGAKLFVNAANDKDHTVEKDGKRVPQREVFLTPDYGNHHDVFFANVGNAQMTGIKVELKNARNIALDEYWTVGETKTLAPFTSANSSQMKNVGKIRLVPEVKDGKQQTGEIGGTLVISCDGGQEVSIDLKGTAGVPTITTESVVKGVKYVAYSSLIQTNNMYSDNVRFSLAGGKLPDGLELRQSGEIYGVPTKAGTFTFTVKAQYPETEYSGGGSGTKQFTLEILDNSNENVDATNLPDAQGYTRTTNLPDVDVSAAGAEDGVYLMESEGIYSQFYKLFLDGKRLTEGVDYDSSEGSTHVVLTFDTLKKTPNGKHTISAEFRRGGNQNGTMKRTSQNFTISGSTAKPSHSGGNGGNGGGGGGSSSVQSYTVTTAGTQHGKVTVSPATAEAGQTVTVTVEPEYGYKLGKLTVSGAKTTYVKDGVYTFAMPYSDVTVTATFVKRDADPETGLPFFDVHLNNWFCENVRYVYENGLMVGTLDNAFSPYQQASRAMFVAVLYRLAGEPEAEEAHHFTDVKAGIYYEKAVAWATANGIIYGTGKDAFSPNNKITREQLATMLYRYLGSPAVSGDLSEFVDGAEADEYAAKALCWAVENGILYGKGNGRLDPLGKATRAEVAAVFQRIAEKED